MSGGTQPQGGKSSGTRLKWNAGGGPCVVRVRGRGEADGAGGGIGFDRTLRSGDIEQEAHRVLAFVLFEGCGQDRGSIGGDQLDLRPVAEQEELK